MLTVVGCERLPNLRPPTSVTPLVQTEMPRPPRDAAGEALQATLEARLVATVAALPTSVAATVAALPTSTPAAVIATPAPPPTGAPRSSASTSLPGVGHRVESPGIALTVNAVTKPLSAGALSAAKPGHTFLVVEATLENTGAANAPYNPLQFTLQDADGLQYIAALVGTDKALHAGELAPGNTASGEVIFEVPITARGFVLSYRPPAILGGQDAIQVSLGE
jgi:hypothetical protein